MKSPSHSFWKIRSDSALAKPPLDGMMPGKVQDTYVQFNEYKNSIFASALYNLHASFKSR